MTSVDLPYMISGGSLATNAMRNSNTNYYTIAGNWIPSLTFTDPNCTPEDIGWLDFQRMGSSALPGPDDGIYQIAYVL